MWEEGGGVPEVTGIMFGISTVKDAGTLVPSLVSTMGLRGKPAAVAPACGMGLGLLGKPMQDPEEGNGEQQPQGQS